MAQVLTSYSDSEFKEVLSEQVREVFGELFKNTKSSGEEPEEKIRYKTREETKRLLNVSLTTLYYWEKAGILIPHRIGRRVLYSIEALAAAVEKQKGHSI
ncbi:helix-turn-helix domain-containing protein [Pedobacter sp. Leaf250]|uniref:helix-turn-helix domain-containing protein n=1 Tax=Pedobacter sp. Leaf250 TaxID=2876559 RepID=UPI001E4E58F8|nr:helix-turn-helix domain-containing protein [Pedobacter sp. Leaf250]